MNDVSLQAQLEPASTLATVGWSRRPVIRLCAISFLVLFNELACIRWFGSTVVFLTFFTNIVLMACFLGMSIGCLRASQPKDLINSVLPLTFASVLLSCVTMYAYFEYGWILVDVGGQGSPQEVFFGTEYRVNDPSRFVIPIELMAGAFFVLIALMFVGLGQELGRTFNAIPNHVKAYSANILGSLGGIAAFMLASHFHTPPFLWFAIFAGTCLYFVRRWTTLQIVSLVGLLTTLALTAYWDGMEKITIWSPYYKVSYAAKQGVIWTNNIGHQAMMPIGEWGTGGYALAHLLYRDAGGRPLRNVMIIGAGSGNDVRTALNFGAEHVDAVEIDPVLHSLGVRDHPGRPYADRRVSTHLDDGRSFLRTTRNSYDLIEYALVDSLVLHSAQSNLRLESFLFTEEAFRDVRSRLKPGGVFVMYNSYRQGWIIERLEAMARKVFETKPVVITLPHTKVIDDRPHQGFTILLVGNGPDSPVEAIRERFAKGESFWLNRRPTLNGKLNGFGSQPPEGPGESGTPWEQVGPATVAGNSDIRMATDDWPYLYLKEPIIPDLNLRGMTIVAWSSLMLLLFLTPIRASRPDGCMFFLGAGFMLLETKGVVHLALLFGSTWAVNAVVFFAILVMILVGNLYVLAIRPRRLLPYYVLLIGALLVNAFVPMSDFLALPGVSRIIASCTVVFLPIFFAAVIFATVFRDTSRPDLALGSNIAGVILGGLSENACLLIGMKSILFVAIAYYLLSAVFARKALR